MITTKVLVDFKKRKAITTEDHRGSAAYEDLIKKGYTEVAVVKSKITFPILPGGEPFVDSYVTSEFFDPKDKYS
jgi:hypothetical protein